jgi:xanthine dehydrogenase accessory factor
MATGLDLWKTLTDWLERGIPVAMVTVIRVEGSAPRHLGARMLCRADGKTAGTVGGGALEQAAVDEARAVLASGTPRVLSYRLKQDLGMACGGNAELYVEPLLPPERLYLFGGGHIGLEVARTATRLGFAVTVIDERMEFAAATRFPVAVALVQTYDPAEWTDLVFDERTFCVVATHGHGIDFAVVQALMTMDPGPRYVGMIGSATKRRKVERQLAEAGVTGDRIAELRTPMGIAIGAETPEEIALSITAELVQVRRAAANTKRS